MAITVKFPLPVAVPSAVVIEIAPVVAPGITMPTNVVPVLDITMAVAPPMVKAVGDPILTPVIVTRVPTEPVVGVNEEIVTQIACVINAPETALVVVLQEPATTQ